MVTIKRNYGIWAIAQLHDASHSTSTTHNLFFWFCFIQKLSFQNRSETACKPFCNFLKTSFVQLFSSNLVVLVCKNITKIKQLRNATTSNYRNTVLLCIRWWGCKSMPHRLIQEKNLNI